MGASRERKLRARCTELPIPTHAHAVLTALSREGCYLQEMSFLLRRAAVALAITAAAVLIPRSAGAYCRTTTQLLPANYNPKACFTEGLVLFWRGACVGYSINQNASRNIPFDDAQRIIDQSFATWVSSTCVDTGQAPGIAISNLGKAECGEVKYNKESANQNLIVFRDDGWPYSDPNSTLGLTTVTFNAETGEIFDADMEINASERNLSTSEQVPASGFDLLSVVTHEAGHFLGLAHATNPTSTMYASYKPGSGALRDLDPDDVAGLCSIYPSSAIRIVDPIVDARGSVEATTCNPNPRHGLTAKCSEPVPAKPSDCGVAPSSQAMMTSSSSASTSTTWAFACLGGVVVAVGARRRRRHRLRQRA
jgi:hypothetical protein